MPINIDTYQTEMQSAFEKQLHVRLNEIRQADVAIEDKVGIENEYLIIDSNYKPVEQCIRDEIVREIPYTKCEIGASQLEFNSLPVSISCGMENLYIHICDFENKLIDRLKAYNCYALRMGCYPGSVNDLKVTTGNFMYQELLDEYYGLRKKCIVSTIGDISFEEKLHEMIIGCQSSQLNIEIGYANACMLLNRLMELAPFFMAIAVNSPIIDNKITNYLEVRELIWKNGYDLREINDIFSDKSFRTGFPVNYYDDINQYWRDMKQQRYMKYDLENAFANNQKMFWRVARIKLTNGKCLLESRFIPIQPTIEEDLAIQLSIYAMLVLYVKTPLSLIPMSFVKENFRRAVKYGLKATVYVYDQHRRKIQEEPVIGVLNNMLDDIIRFWSEFSIDTAAIIETVFRNRFSRGTPASQEAVLLEEKSAKKLMQNYII